MKLELWIAPHRKHPYLIFHEGTVGNVVGQIKIPKTDFWKFMAHWLHEEFGVNVIFKVDGKEISHMD